MVDRVEHVPQFQRAVAAALQGHGQHDPGSRVGVLAAVLADAWHVPLDVARLQRSSIEGRVEELNQLALGAHQSLLDRGHRPLGPRRVGGP